MFKTTQTISYIWITIVRHYVPYGYNISNIAITRFEYTLFAVQFIIFHLVTEICVHLSFFHRFFLSSCESIRPKRRPASKQYIRYVNKKTELILITLE